MSERVARFGRTAQLVGVLSEASGDSKPTGVGAVLLNSGILHRVGACRLHVRLGRRLAAAGIPSLRFDFSGIGDSETRRDSLSFEESAMIEASEALDYVTATQDCDQFVLIGLCSGADVAFRVAVRDPRVTRLVLYDPWVYRTARSYIQHYARQIVRPRAWVEFIQHRLPTRRTKQASLENLEMPAYVRRTPQRQEVSAQVREMLDRGVRILCIFSGGQEGYIYRSQFERALGIGRTPSLNVVHLPQADHIFSGLEDQARLIEATFSWITEASDQGIAGAERPPRPLGSPAREVLPA